MSDFRQRLQECYKNVRNSDLVRNKKVSEETMNYVVENINNALPKNDNELDNMKTVKTLFHGEPNVFKALLKSGDARFVFYTNSITIVDHFKISRLVRLNWDSDKHLYSMEEFKPKKQG